MTQNRASIGRQLFFAFLLFFLFLAAGFTLLYLSLERSIRTNTSQQLTTSNQLILELIRSSVDLSIRNHLRGITVSSLDMVADFHRQSEERILTENEAREAAAALLLQMQIGETGYIYIIDSTGEIQVHPSEDLLGADLSRHEFIRKQITMREGYIEYDWANPGETRARPKSLYMTYFAPWDWIISASSYRREFLSLFRLEDVASKINSLRFGETGYAYVINSLGDFLLHPAFIETNAYEVQQNVDKTFLNEMLSKKRGEIIYDWQNPAEPSPREKYVIYDYIEEYDWIVGTSTYMSEVNAPLTRMGLILIPMALLTIGLLFITYKYLRHKIALPIRKISESLKRAQEGDLSSRAPIDGRGEVKTLAEGYNSFIDNLEKEMIRRNQAEESLKEFNLTLEAKVAHRTKDLKQAMEELQSTQQRLIQSSRLAALGQMVSGIAHQLNTPLGVCVTAASHIKTKTNKLSLPEDSNPNIVKCREVIDEGLKLIESNLFRLVQMIQVFKKIALPETREKLAETDIPKLLMEVETLLKGYHQNSPPKIVIDCPAGLKVFTYSAILRDLLYELGTNAIKHSDRVNPTLTFSASESDGKFTLSLFNTGSPIPKEIRDKIFDPFFTTRHLEGDLGLGLYIVYNLVTNLLLGEVGCTSTDDGNIFTLTLPQNKFAEAQHSKEDDHEPKNRP